MKKQKEIEYKFGDVLVENDDVIFLVIGVKQGKKYINSMLETLVIYSKDKSEIFMQINYGVSYADRFFGKLA